MRIAAHIGVKDEVELLEGAIAHLRSIGVDHIIAVDNYSTDGSADILAKHRNKDDFSFVQIDDLEPDGDEKIWLRRNLDALDGIRADWVIFLDADERWLPATGSLRDCPDLANTDVAIVPRYNVVLNPDGPTLPSLPGPKDYDRTLLFTKPFPHFRAHLHAHPKTPWIRGVPGPKVMARPECIGSLTDGMHDIIATDGMNPKRHRSNDVVIAHLPFTTLPRFRKKVVNIRRQLAVHDAYFGVSMAWHWRRWVALDDLGRLEEEFRHQMLSAQEISTLRGSGDINSVSELFSAKSPKRGSTRVA